MSNLIEMQDAIETLAPKERTELWDWFQAQEVEETDEMLAAVDEGIRSHRRTRWNSCGRGSETDSEMDYKVNYLPNAIRDLAEIVRFVAQDDPQAALRLGKQLADDADLLARLPYGFPKFHLAPTFGSWSPGNI
jgi:hypothetical protein